MPYKGMNYANELGILLIMKGLFNTHSHKQDKRIAKKIFTRQIIIQITFD